MPDILAIVSKAVFERDARVDGDVVKPKVVWPVDRYNSTNKALQPLATGGRIFLVTVRPPNEHLWLVGVIDRPTFDGTAWVAAAPNQIPVTDITRLRKTIVFESGKGMSQDKGTLGMSLQTPRTLAASDVTQIMDVVGGVAPAVAETFPSNPSGKITPPKPVRVIGGKYEIVRELGKGGMGVVYEGRHSGTGRRVAVKEIVGDLLGEEDESNIIQRFQREARATGAIETRHIVPVLDVGADPVSKNPYLVMELLRGEDLQDLMNRIGRLPEAVAVKIVAQACTGLCHAHRAGVVHRDIKPANLFLARVDDEVVVKLLDFGVARVKEKLATEARTLTETGAMLGTPLYMSPEQVVGSKNLDHRADLWSLGVVLYEALSGATPHGDAETLGALLVGICSKPALSLRELAPDVSEPVVEIVMKSLALDPAQRYASADDLLADLKQSLPVGGGIGLDHATIEACPVNRLFDDDDIPFSATSFAES